jgi:hypothetical protein
MRGALARPLGKAGTRGRLDMDEILIHSRYFCTNALANPSAFRRAFASATCAVW